MKNFLSNSNLYILLLAPIFIITAVFFYNEVTFDLPEFQPEIIGLFNRRTIFQVLCEAVFKLKL